MKIQSITKLITLAAVCLLVLAVLPVSGEDTSDMRWRLTETQSKSVQELGSIFWANLAGPWGSDYSGPAYAGALYMTVEEFNLPMDATSGHAAAPYNTYTFCVDGQILKSPDWFTKAVGGLPPNNYPSQDPSKWSRIVYLNQQHYFEALTDSAKAAGLQLAYWEIVNDYDPMNANWASLSAGNFRASGFSAQAASYTTSWLADLGTADYSGQVYYWDGQNQIDHPSVPEPFTVLYGIVGLGSIASLRRLRKA